MSKNKANIKSTFSNIRPSEECIDKIYEQTTDKRKIKGYFVKRGLSAVLAVAIIIGTGFGINNIKTVETPAHGNANAMQTEQNRLSALSVMVAYAGDLEETDKASITVGSVNKQPLFYTIHYADINDPSAVEKLNELFKKEKSELNTLTQELSNKGYSTTIRSSKSIVDNSKTGKLSAKIHIINGCSLALSLDDYTNVKQLTIKNESKYGQLYCAYQNTNDNTQSVVDKVIKISGDDLRYSKKSTIFEGGTKHKYNKGYELTWDRSFELEQAIADDLNFDLSQVKDTINFTVEYNDGTVQSAKLNLYFDKDGYMHFE